ncbi:hypothetical protein FACS1894218_4970 [Bacilli bacterium]|nr:hypothetical protein FACS1894218_4970 [Bacilli bacterium]
MVVDKTTSTIFVYYAKTITYDSLVGAPKNGNGVFIQAITSGAASTYVKTTVIALSVSSAILAVYAFARLN